MAAFRRSAASAMGLLLGLVLLGAGPGFETLLTRAYRLAEQGKLTKAESCYREARELHPRSSKLALQHAIVLARLGDRERALEAIEEAATLGYDAPDDLRDEPAFSALLDEPRFKGAVAATFAAEAALRRTLVEARRLPEPGSVPAASSLKELEEVLERESRRRSDDPSFPASPMQEWVAHVRHTAR
jgi:tetratricopeptide (TPR) repeat protein